MMSQKYWRKGHEFVVAGQRGDVLIADEQPRGGLQIQVGQIDPDGFQNYSFHSVIIPRRYVAALKKYLSRRK